MVLAEMNSPLTDIKALFKVKMFRIPDSKFVLFSIQWGMVCHN